MKQLPSQLSHGDLIHSNQTMKTSGGKLIAKYDLLNYKMQPSTVVFKKQLKFHTSTLEHDIPKLFCKNQSQKVIKSLAKFFISCCIILITFGLTLEFDVNILKVYWAHNFWRQ